MLGCPRESSTTSDVLKEWKNLNVSDILAQNEIFSNLTSVQLNFIQYFLHYEFASANCNLKHTTNHLENNGMHVIVLGSCVPFVAEAPIALAASAAAEVESAQSSARGGSLNSARASFAAPPTAPPTAPMVVFSASTDNTPMAWQSAAKSAPALELEVMGRDIALVHTGISEKSVSRGESDRKGGWWSNYLRPKHAEYTPPPAASNNSSVRGIYQSTRAAERAVPILASTRMLSDDLSSRKDPAVAAALADATAAPSRKQTEFVCRVGSSMQEWLCFTQSRGSLVDCIETLEPCCFAVLTPAAVAAMSASGEYGRGIVKAMRANYNYKLLAECRAACKNSILR